MKSITVLPKFIGKLAVLCISIIGLVAFAVCILIGLTLVCVSFLFVVFFMSLADTIAGQESTLVQILEATGLKEKLAQES